MMLVVERERPEAVDRRLLARRKRDLVVLASGKRGAGRIIVGVEVLRLGRLVVECRKRSSFGSFSCILSAP